MICPTTDLNTSCTLSKAYGAGSPWRLANTLSDSVARICCGWYPSHQRIWSTWLWFLTLTVLLSSVVMTSKTSTYCSGIWFLDSTQKYVSSPVMILWSKSGSVWRCSMISKPTCMWCSFWSSFSSLSTNFVQTFCNPKSLVIIFQTLCFFMSC